MRVVFPHVGIGSDPAVIRDYAQAVEALGEQVEGHQLAGAQRL